MAAFIAHEQSESAIVGDQGRIGGFGTANGDGTAE